MDLGSQKPGCWAPIKGRQKGQDGVLKTPVHTGMTSTGKVAKLRPMRRSVGVIPLCAHPVGWSIGAIAWAWSPLAEHAGKWAGLAEILWRLGILGFLAAYTFGFAGVVWLQLRRRLPMVNRAPARLALALYSVNVVVLGAGVLAWAWWG